MDHVSSRSLKLGTPSICRSSHGRRGRMAWALNDSQRSEGSKIMLPETEGADGGCRRPFRMELTMICHQASSRANAHPLRADCPDEGCLTGPKGLDPSGRLRRPPTETDARSFSGMGPQTDSHEWVDFSMLTNTRPEEGRGSTAGRMFDWGSAGTCRRSTRSPARARYRAGALPACCNGVGHLGLPRATPDGRGRRSFGTAIRHPRLPAHFASPVLGPRRPLQHAYSCTHADR